MTAEKVTLAVVNIPKLQITMNFMHREIRVCAFHNGLLTQIQLLKSIGVDEQTDIKPLHCLKCYIKGDS